MSQIVMSVFSVVVVIVIWQLAVLLLDMIHSLFGVVIMRIVGFCVGWETSQYTLEGAFFDTAFAQLIIGGIWAAIEYCVPAVGEVVPEEIQIFVAASITTLMLFGGGMNAAADGSVCKCLIFGTASIAAIPVAIFLVGTPIVLLLAGLANQ